MTGRRRAVLAGAGVLVVAVAALAAAGLEGSPAAPAPSKLPPATATVTRTDLTQTVQVGGILSFGTPKQVTVRSPGTVTWMAPVGSTVTLGEPVYKLDQRPAVLIRGSVPPYRTLRPGIEGADVQQLEQSLAALGYTGFTVDAAYTAETAAAVRDWQGDLGARQTGTVEVDQIVVAPGDIRIGLHLLAVGDRAGTEVNEPLLTYTGTTQVVTVALDVAKQHLVDKGVEATVTLPGGIDVAGTVTSVGAVATGQAPEEGEGAAGSSEPPTVEVVISLADPDAAGDLDAAPVDVTLVAERREDVLAVPVAALVALAEGGYGVQVVDGGGHPRYVAVETGMFADGLVEVSGKGITEGTVVGVPE